MTPAALSPRSQVIDLTMDDDYTSFLANMQREHNPDIDFDLTSAPASPAVVVKVEDVDSDDELPDMTVEAAIDIANKTTTPPLTTPAIQPKRGPQGRGRHNIADLSTIGQSHVRAPDAGPALNKDNTFTKTTKTYEAIRQMAINRPAYEKDITQEELKDAFKSFTNRQCKPVLDEFDREYKWSLTGVNTLMHTHQFLAVGAMRRRENGDATPHGGILADAMGFGSE
jgi:hypothetical protein